MNYSMTTLYPSTRIRADHSTYAGVLGNVGAGVTVYGDLLWTASADGTEVKAGDKWMHVTVGNVTGWMACVHKGAEICANLKEITEDVQQQADIEKVIVVFDDGQQQEFFPQ